MMSHNILFLAFLYFVQGLPYGLQTWFLPVFFRSRGMSLSNIGFFKLLLTPWMCKALWAPFVDHCGTKKSWLIWSMVGLVMTCVIGSFSGPSYLSQLACILLLFNFLTSTQDIAVDGLAIQILSSSELANGNSAQVVGYKIGAVVGGGLLTWLSDYLNWMMLFQCLAFIYIAAIVTAWKYIPSDHSQNITNIPAPDITQESEQNSLEQEAEKRKSEDTLSWIIGHFKMIVNTEGTLWIALYVVLYKLGEKGSLAMIPLFLLDKGISASQVGFWTGMMGQMVSIGGSLLGGLVMSGFGQSPLKLLKLLSVIKTMVLAAMCPLIWLWSPAYTTLNTSLIIGLMLLLLLISGYITTATFTLMMECSQRAPQSVQASHYTTLATIEVLGKLSFSVVTGWITDLTSYSTVFILFTVLSAIILPIFRYAPSILTHTNSHRRNKSR